MKSSYKVVINSAKGENQLTGSNQNVVMTTLSNSVTFPFVSWSQMMPEGKYKLTWSYVGSGNMLKNNESPKIRINGLINNNCYETTNNGAKTNIDLGYLKCGGLKLYSNANTNNEVGFLYANIDDNPPIILNSRPHNGPIKIEILDKNDKLWYDDIGYITSGGTMTKSGGTGFNTLNIRDIPNNTRLNIGSKLIRAGTGLDFAKITDFITGLGAPSSGGTLFSYRCTETGFATGGVTLALDDPDLINPVPVPDYTLIANPPGHYILQLNLEEIP